MFESEHETPVELEVKRVEIDVTKMIRKISLKLYKRTYICGIRIIDSNNQPLLQENFGTPA